MEIDLLNSFGDWIQLIGCFFGVFMILPSISNIFFRDYSSLTIFTTFFIIVNILIPPSLLYIYVYDYDLILGFFLGSIHSIWINIKNVEFYQLRGDTHKRRLYKLSNVTCGIIILVMVYKIIVYVL